MFRVTTLAPAGGFPSPWRLISTLRLHRLCCTRDARASDQLTCVLAAQASGRGREKYSVLLTGSGKAALLTLLTALKRRAKKELVFISAYTCPDVAAAVLRAGFKPYLVDVVPETLELACDRLPLQVLDSAAGVVLSNLYGVPDSLQFWRHRKREDENFFIVDDACQAFQSQTSEGRPGTRRDTFGVVSFGRGKSFCGQGGGAVIAPAGAGELANDVRMEAPEALRGFDMRAHALSVLSWICERPLLYSVPSSLPGLHLGETHCDLDFALSGITEAQALSALSVAGLLDADAEARAKKTRVYEAGLSGVPGLSVPSSKPGVDPEVALLRFPVVFSERALRDEVVRGLERRGLGANTSYPRAIADFAEFDGKLAFDDIQGARSLAERVMTLPLHRYVTGRMQKTIETHIRSSLCS